MIRSSRAGGGRDLSGAGGTKIPLVPPDPLNTRSLSRDDRYFPVIDSFQPALAPFHPLGMTLFREYMKSSGTDQPRASVLIPCARSRVCRSEIRAWIFASTRFSTNSAAMRMAFLMAFAFDRP